VYIFVLLDIASKGFERSSYWNENRLLQLTQLTAIAFYQEKIKMLTILVTAIIIAAVLLGIWKVVETRKKYYVDYKKIKRNLKDKNQ